MDLAFLAGSILLVLLVAGGLSGLLRHRLRSLDDFDRRTASRLVFYILAAFGILGGLDGIGVDVAAPLLPWVGLQMSLLGLTTFLSVLAAVLFGSSLLRKLTETRLLVRTRLDPGARYAVARILYYIVLTLGLLATLQTTGLQLSSLTVAIGALSVGIGFGLQNIVNNFVSGLILLFERPVQVGDWVEVEGTSGRITQIGARSITVITNDNISILVPNATMISNQVVNWSHGDPKVRIRLPVGVAYGSDLDLVVRVLLEVAAASEHVLQEPPPRVFFDGFGDSALDLELAVWIDIRQAALRRVRSDLNFAVFRAFREYDIEIPFPQRDLHFRSSELPSPPQPGLDPGRPGAT